MELKQMEYLVAAVENKSLNKAAERLYTSQPNISKVLKNLEEELSMKLLERTSKGVYLTQTGEKIYDYAKNMLKTSRIIEEIAENASYEHLKIASYPSNMITRKLSQFYMETRERAVHIEFTSGTVEEVVDQVQTFSANIGFVYYGSHQEHTFKQLLARKHLTYHPLKSCKLCLYVGPQHPYYNQGTITYDSLKDLKFVQGKSDFFSVLDSISAFSDGVVSHSQVKHVVHTNSDHAMMNMLRHTDLCSVGIDLIDLIYKDDDIRKVTFVDGGECLALGYVTRDNYVMNWQEDMFLGYMDNLMKTRVD